MDGEFQAISREPAYLKVCRAIEDKIANGDLQVGDALPTESTLCAQFQITRSTVREGIRMLEQTGLVRRGHGKRLYVTQPKSDDVAERASRSLALGGATFLEVWEALYAIYPAIARVTAKLSDPNAITALRVHCDALRALDDKSPDKVVDHAVGFFQEISIQLDNRVTAALLQSLNMMIDASMRRMMRGTPNARSRIIEAQTNILVALEQRDAADAERWMQRHIADLKRGYELAGLDLNDSVN